MSVGTPRMMGLNIEALALPEDLSGITEGSDLVNSTLPGQNTLKYYVRDRPDLLVRIDSMPFDELANSLGELCVLHRDYDIPVPPFALVERDSGDLPPDGAIITTFVNGPTLSEALANDVGGHVASQSDRLLANLSRGLAGRRHAMPSDIFGGDQYMVGTIFEETENRLLLVDFPSPLCFNEHMLALGTVYLANFILETEATSGRRMPQGRAAFYEALADLPDYIPHGKGGLTVAAEIQLALQKGTKVSHDW